jgi:hypothetical protein
VRQPTTLGKWIGSAALAVCATVAAPRAFAGDPYNLELGLPVTVIDTAPGTGLQFQLFARYDRTSDSRDQTLLSPQLQWGFAQDWHLEVQSPYIVGDADRTGSGDIQVGLFWNFFKEPQNSPLPSLAVHGLLIAPTGVGSDGLDTELELVATKTLTGAPSQDEVHANVRWDHNSVPASDERQDRFTFVAGYSRRLAEQTILVADFVREQQQTRGEESNVVEVGVLQGFGENAVFSVGLGAGIGDDSPNFRAIVGFQWSMR